MTTVEFELEMIDRIRQPLLNLKPDEIRRPLNLNLVEIRRPL